jgi:hypothetical protein
MARYDATQRGTVKRNPEGQARHVSRSPVYTTRMPEKKSVSEAFEQAAREMETQVNRAVEYIEANIVPKARRDGEKVLRRLSEELSRWADRLHDEQQPK